MSNAIDTHVRIYFGDLAWEVPVKVDWKYDFDGRIQLLGVYLGFRYANGEKQVVDIAPCLDPHVAQYIKACIEVHLNDKEFAG